MAKSTTPQKAIRRALAMFIGLSVMGGCGFKPMLAVHDDQASVSEELAQTRVASIEGRSGQILRNDLLDTLNPRGNESQGDFYTLFIRIEEPQQNLAFQRSNSVTDVNYGVVAYWTLQDKKGIVIFSSVSSSSQLYVISNSQYATAVAAQNARDRVVADVSQDIRNKLSQFFIARKPAAATTSTTSKN